MFKQLSVYVENSVGSLSKVTQVLVDNDINIRAISSYDTPDYTILRLVVDKLGDAKKVLEEKQYIVRLTDAIAIELEDKPGSLNEVLKSVADSGHALNYIYSLVLREKNKPLMIISVDDIENAAFKLKEKGFKVVD